MHSAFKYLATLCVVTFTWNASAHMVLIGDLQIIHAWAEPSEKGNTRVFTTISNDGAKAATLLTMETDAAERVEITRQGRVLDRLTIPADDSVVFGEDGLDLTLVGLTAPLIKGEKFFIAVKFEGYRTIDLTVLVGEDTAMGNM